MRWTQLGHDKLMAWGRLQHKVWRAAVVDGFYATSGLDTHGPYSTAAAARAECERRDRQ